MAARLPPALKLRVSLAFSGICALCGVELNGSLKRREIFEVALLSPLASTKTDLSEHGFPVSFISQSQHGGG